MPLTLYGLKNCDTCKKALKALEAADKNVTFIDIRSEADLPTVLLKWLSKAGADRLINRRSTTWRTLSEDERNADPMTLLAAHPTLIKRPVIERGDEVFVGWSKNEQSVLL
ncbi:MAG: ArsC/Spx/MgsR family protein [Pseudomonadota bacterium]